MTTQSNRIRLFRQQKGLTLQQLADAIGTSKSQIDKLEKGDRRLTVDWMIRLARPLGCSPKDLMELEAAPETKAHTFSADSLPSLPVRGTVQKGKSQALFLTDEPVDQVPRPHYLAHAKDAYALYVVEESMAPMYRPRQLLFINPYKLPVPGNGVVVIKTDGSFLIKEYVKANSESVVLREHQPTRRDFTLEQKEIASLHPVVGTIEAG